VIPYGPWHPDVVSINANALRQAQNCRPVANGFAPLQQPTAVSEALPATCRGAVTVLQLDGTGASYAGTEEALYSLQPDLTWTDVTRAVGGAYGVTSGERWRFTSFGDLIIATSYTDDIQKASISGGGAFQALGGTPPKARYIDVMRDFVVLACLDGNENRIHWSGLNDAEGWTIGTNSSDIQDFPSGGPVTGFLGGEVGYVFQRERVTRMTYLPGSDIIMQFDQVEGGRGLAAPNSLVRLGQEAFYLTSDGFYRMSLVNGGAQPIGIGKWHDWFTNDIKPGSDLFVYGALTPANDAILWAYISKDSPSVTTPNKVVLYNFHLDEATTALLDVEAVAPWLTAGFTLDTINSFGDLDNLPVSLDSPFWKGGAPIAGIIGTDNKLQHFEGSNMEATFITSDGQREGRRTHINGIRPHIDTSAVTVEIGGRERDSDVVSYGPVETMEDTGWVPTWVSGNYLRARIKVPAGSTWNVAKGFDVDFADAGKR
jgi:hypothetical protein